MKDPNTSKISLVLVFILVSLMGSFVFIQFKIFDLFNLKDDGLQIQKAENHSWGEIKDIKAAKGMYLSLKDRSKLPHFIDKSVKQRTLKYFYSLRAYGGAPPIIPHEISSSESLTGDSCLGCHQYGGFTPKFNAYAPVVPHPEKRNCRQCHNSRNTGTLFKKTSWIKRIPRRGFSHLPGSPLVIPHSIQMRENCLSCHSGPSAVVEIRTTHPERINCMQCHVEKREDKIWRRK